MVRWLIPALASLSLVAAAGAGCELLVGIPQVVLAADGGAADGGALDGGAPVIVPCGRVRADGVTRAGPDMVKIDSDFGSYCIDTTEVTVADFNAYVLDAGSWPGAPGGCAAVGDLCDDEAGIGAIRPPLVDSLPADQTFPIGHVIWCDAWAYCHWAGKRMCGAIGDGGPVQGHPPQETEWYFACTNGKANTPYPYGTTYDPTACNSEGDGSVPVRSMPRCHGMAPPFDQIYDMVGNVTEFVLDDENANLCDGVGPMGGGWDNGNLASCAGGYSGFNGCCFAFDTSGFRCCADP
jgi:formylglycine-generating enzyme required for sulfatase activity